MYLILECFITRPVGICDIIYFIPPNITVLIWPNPVSVLEYKFATWSSYEIIRIYKFSN